MTFKDLMEELFPDYTPMTSNKLKEILHLSHTEQCRRWLRGTFKPSDYYVMQLAIAAHVDFKTLMGRVHT